MDMNMHRRFFMNLSHSAKIATLAALAALAGCAKQKEPEDIPFNVDQAMELYGVPAGAPVQVDPNTVLLTVDGVEITHRELQTEIFKLLRQVNPEKLPPEQLEQIKQQVVSQAEQNIIQRAVLLNAIENAHVTVPAEKIDEGLNKITASLPEGTTLDQFLESRKVTLDQLRQSIESEIKVSTLLREKVGTVEDPSLTDVRAFYNDNPDQFNIPEQVSGRHILVRLKKDASGEAFIAKKKKIREIHKRLVAGESFEALMAVESEDTNPGGKIPTMRKGNTLPAIEAVVFDLQPGEFTKPVKTEHGFHIIQVQQKQPAKVVSLEEAMPQISNFLKQKNQQKAVSEYIVGLMENAKIETPQANQE